MEDLLQPSDSKYRHLMSCSQSSPGVPLSAPVSHSCPNLAAVLHPGDNTMHISLPDHLHTDSPFANKYRHQTGRPDNVGFQCLFFYFNQSLTSWRLLSPNLVQTKLNLFYSMFQATITLRCLLFLAAFWHLFFFLTSPNCLQNYLLFCSRDVDDLFYISFGRNR